MWALIVSVPDHCSFFTSDLGEIITVNIFIQGRILSSINGSKLIFHLLNMYFY